MNPEKASSIYSKTPFRMAKMLKFMAEIWYYAICHLFYRSRCARRESGFFGLGCFQWTRRRKMRKLGMCTLILMVGVGMIVMGGCSDSATSSLPKSNASYMGSNMPANIDSTTGPDYVDLYDKVLDGGGAVPTSDSGAHQMSYNNTQEGDISGTWTVNYSINNTWGPTGTSDFGSGSDVYDNWQDSGVENPYIMRGSGSHYYEYAHNQNYDGVEPEEPTPAGNGNGGSGVGTYLGEDEMFHENFSDFAESSADPLPDFFKDPFDELTAGWASLKYSYLESPRGWNVNQDANIAYNNFTDEEYFGLLNASAAADYDGSVTTLAGAGELCEEGIPLGIEGCLDYEMDLLWHGDAEETSALPDEGTMNISTEEASAMYDYSAYAGTCALYSLDSDNDGAYEFSIPVGSACP
jgi:hypothetical protein